jgi:hypothetical protein
MAPILFSGISKLNAIPRIARRSIPTESIFNTDLAFPPIQMTLVDFLNKVALRNVIQRLNYFHDEQLIKIIITR